MSETVVIIGRSIAGLAAARVLSQRAKRVLVIESDTQADDTPRKGVPQGRQIHILLKRGEVILERLYPGFCEDLLAAGAQKVDVHGDLAWYHVRSWKPRFASDLHVHFTRRPIVEDIVRRRTEALGNVEFRSGARVTGLAFDNGRVVGVKVDDEVISADLVVDASGRGSQVARWINEAGYPKPPVDSIGIDVSYATALVRLAEPPTEYKALALYPALPIPGWGIVFPVDNGQHIVTLMGYFDDVPGTDRASYIEFSSRLGVPHLHALIKDAEFVAEPVRYHFKGTRYIRYDRAKRLPRGLIALGDALCAFNPVFGQGMTTALMTAEVIEELTQSGSLDIDPALYFKRAAETLAFPWRTGVTEDFRSPHTTGSKPFGLRLNQVLTDLMHARSSANERFYQTYSQVLHMLRPPSALLNPRGIADVLLGSKKAIGRPPTPRSSVTSAPQPYQPGEMAE